jgi:hypothetical protein
MKAMRAVPFVQLAVCVLLAAGFANEARAQAGPAQTLLDGKFVGNLGGFIVGTDFKASLNGESTTNPEVDFDKTFGDGSDQRGSAATCSGGSRRTITCASSTSTTRPSASASSTPILPGATTSSPPAVRSS